MATDVKKLSFAKVAASAKDIPSRVPPTLVTSTGTLPSKPAALKPTVTHTVTATKPTAKVLSATAATSNTAKIGGLNGASITESSIDTKVVDGLNDLQLDSPTPNLVVNGSGSTITERSSKTGNSQSPSDNVSQRADSSSDLGTKPPSLDGKSITSGTTFALDEKESLRPDDSASMKAAAEDDDSFSIRGSFLPGSRIGSEVAARFRIQLGDMPPRTIMAHRTVEPVVEGIATPQSGASDKQAAVDTQIPANGGASGQESLIDNGFFSQYPDEKLLEAMRTPSDRLFLLRLEKDVIDFVQNSKEPFMDLPPSNSFCRMLTHKLADYYHMTHSFESVGAVRIYRTPFCRVPPSLASIAVSSPNTDTVTPSVLPRKIMRRGEDGEMVSSSASPSKPTSEVGGDGREKPALAKEKPTREEREEAYNRARERIFGKDDKAEISTPDNEETTDASRASSVSAKDRSNLGKRGKTGRQRREDSESFDSRSAYAPVYGPTQQPTWLQPQYLPMVNPQFNGQYQQPFPNAMSPASSFSPSQAYPPPIVANASYLPQPYSTMPQQYAPQPVPQRYQAPPAPPPPPPAPAPMASYNAPIQNVPQPAWQSPTSSPGSYQSRTQAAPGIPYAYGQLPVNVNPNDPKSQHPIPGSYTRRPFNPTIQSFVPGGAMQPMQAAPPGPFNGAAPPYGSPRMHPQDMAYNTYQPNMPQQPPSYAGNGPGYGMARQGSNNSMAPSHLPPPFQAPLPQQQHGVPLGPVPVNIPPSNLPPPHMVSNPPNMPNIPQGPHQTYTHLPNYGNPATLPQKPST